MILRHIFTIFIALLACAFVWWVGPLISVGVYRPLYPLWVRVVIVVLLLTWALWPLLGAMLSRLRRTGPRRVTAPVGLGPVTARLNDAARTLRHVGLASQQRVWPRLLYRMARGHLHDRPWYLVLGPPGVGKSTLLRNSGQHFVFSEHYGLPMTTAPGATQDCNVWLTDKAVFIDTAGNCLAHNGMDVDTSSAWSTLLRRVRRMRRFPSIDGIVLCLDAAWLLQAPLASRKSLADALRGRLLEVAAWFRHDVRVHLLINRVDTLPGGATLLSLLPEKTLDDGIGMTLPMSFAGSPVAAADEGYRELEARLQRQAAEAIHALRDPGDDSVRGELLQSLERIGELRQPLLDLLEQIFPSTPVGYSGRLRSIWLGSAVEVQWRGTGAGFDEPRSLGHVYRRPLQLATRERDWVGKDVGTGWRARMAGMGAFASTALLLAVVCTVLTGRYLWEREYIGSAWAGFNDARRISHDAVAAPNGRAAVVQAAAELRYMAVLLDDAYGTGASPMLNPYTEHRLVKDSVSRTYHRHLQKVFWPEVQRYVAQTLADDTAMQSADLYETLKVYLMLATPERRNADALVAWFDRRWERLAPPGSTASDQGAFDYHLRALFEPAGDAVPAMKVDTDLLRGARVRAADLPLPQRVVSRIQALPMPAGIDGVSLASAGGGQVSLALRRGGEATANDIAVSGLFTRDGYSQLFLAQLDRTAANVLEEGAWVLDEGVDAGRRGGAYTTTQRLTDDAHRLYLQQYADVWDGFLKDIRIRPVASLDDASQLANQLAAPSSPLGNVVGFAAAQTTLAGNADGSLARATRSIEKGKVALIDQLAGERSSTGSLAGQIVDAHFESLHRLARRGDDRQADDPLARMFAELADQLGTLVGALRAGQIMPRSDVLTRLRGDANRQPEPVRGIVNELIRIAGTQSLQSSRSQLAQGASGLGSGVCARTVTGRYPFDRGASDEIGMDDFIKVFGRRGALQTFFDANLASHVDANAYPWRARADADGGATVVGAGTLRSFENATRIRDAFFTASDAIGFSMILRPIELDASILEATLDIDGQVLKYAHGPQQPMRIDWPGPRGGVYARLTLRLANGQTEALNFDGPWALFRLFDAAGKRVLGADRRELTVQTGSGRFRFEIRSSMQDFPLWSQALARFRCPS